VSTSIIAPSHATNHQGEQRLHAHLTGTLSRFSAGMPDYLRGNRMVGRVPVVAREQPHVGFSSAGCDSVRTDRDCNLRKGFYPSFVVARVIPRRDQPLSGWPTIRPRFSGKYCAVGSKPLARQTLRLQRPKNWNRSWSARTSRIDRAENASILRADTTRLLQHCDASRRNIVHSVLLVISRKVLPRNFSFCEAGLVSSHVDKLRSVAQWRVCRNHVLEFQIATSVTRM
jgi:hypothetical protein